MAQIKLVNPDSLVSKLALNLESSLETRVSLNQVNQVNQVKHMNIPNHIALLIRMSKNLQDMHIEANNAGMTVLALEYSGLAAMIDTRVERMNKIVSYVDQANKADFSRVGE